jgi:hypothetical protein
MFQRTFKVLVANYDFNSDTLTATVEPTDPEAQEQFAISNEFSNRVAQIRDITDHAGDVELDYSAYVLLAFTRAFKRAYHSLTHEASPGDVFDKPFTFIVEFAD